MSLMKIHALHLHSSRRDWSHGSFQSAMLSSLQVSNLNEVLRRRRIVTRCSVLNGRETKSSKKPTHHGKGTKKKGVAEQQQSVKKEKTLLEEKSSSNGGILTTDLGSSSALAPADYCNVEEELDELDDEDDELHFYRALVLDLSYRCNFSSD